MVYVLSIDSATKSLAISIVKYNTNLSNDISDLYNSYIESKKTLDDFDTIQNYSKLLADIDLLLHSRFDVKYLDVIDLIPNNKVTDVSIVDRTKKLYDYLNNTLDNILQSLDINNNEWLFLIEYQMGQNQKSNIISSQLIYHLSKYNHPLEIIGPSLKNKIVIGGSDGHYSNFIESHTTNYAANKSHSRYNFLTLIKRNNLEDSIKHIKKKNIDDIADAVLQGLSYVIKYRGF